MSALCRRSFHVLGFVALSLLALSAYGQDCAQVCDPYSSGCDDYCQDCLWYTMDGCGQWVDASCGEGPFGGGRPCIPSNCTPNWVETSRVTEGTYDGRSLWGCTHHVVQEVTRVDYNQCNTYSGFWTQVTCEDNIDDYKNGCCYPSCCEGTGELGTQLECNGVHSCS